MADMLDALLVRPLAFGSRSASIVDKLTAMPGGLSGIEEASAGSRHCLRILLSRGEKAVADVFDTGVGHEEKCVGGYPKANEWLQHHLTTPMTQKRRGWETNVDAEGAQRNEIKKGRGR
jgi:hypothetical protein